MPNILIAGEPEFCKSLSRALLNVKYLKESLERFVLTPHIEEKLVLSNIEGIEENIKNQDVNLLIVHFDEDKRCIETLMRIRSGTIREDKSRIPIIFISFLPFQLLSYFLICHHLKDEGCFIEVPFTLQKLKRALEIIKEVEDTSLSIIKEGLFCPVLDFMMHHINEENFHQKINEINGIIRENRPDIYDRTLDIINDLIIKIDKKEETFENLKHEMLKLVKKIKDEEYGKNNELEG
jgi:hypothetical protein